ncbi:hypothetical protein M8J77_010790 [Diaphorina citri]|nr:hypothetical protein M8J77_010790 [Diaphorina citri]
MSSQDHIVISYSYLLWCLCSGFSFVPSNSSEYGNLKIIENNFYKDYRERLEKHVNLLRLKGTLRADSISNNLNPELEGVHVGLLTSVLSHINGRACVVVFLPNDDTIRTVYQCLTNTQSFQTDNYAILKYQSKITKKSARYKELLKQDKTVIILVTDSIEAVDYMKHVSHIIDCGLYEKHDYLPHFNVNSRDMNWATRQIADERKAWCEKRNSCKFYRLYTSVRGSHLKGCCSSYLGRIRPDHVTYLIKRLSIHDVHAFLEHLDIKPQHRSIHLSIKRFKAMNILDSTEYLTPLGYALSCLPLPPHLARLAILGCIFSCIDPVLSIVAVLLHHDPFDQTMTEDVSSMKAKFSTGTPSDHLVWVQVLAWYQNLLPTHNRTSLSTLCESHGLLYDSLVLLHRVKGHLLSHLAQAGYTKSERLDDPESNVNAACGGLIVALVNAGLYPNVAVIRSPRKIVISKLMSVSIHPSSVYHATSVECTQHTRKFISYSHCYGCDMGSDTEKMYIEHISMVPSAAVILFSHDFHIPVRKQNKFSVTKRAYHFRCASENMVLFLERLRCRLHEIIESTIVNHSYIDWTSQSTDNNVLRCAVQLLRNQNDVCQVIDVEFKKKQKGKKQKKRDKR